MNPWKLSSQEARTIEAIITTGRRKTAADKMGIAVVTLDDYIKIAKRKMGVQGFVQAAVHFDRWHREQ